MTNKVTDGFDWLPTLTTSSSDLTKMGTLMSAASYYAGDDLTWGGGSYFIPITGRFDFGKGVRCYGNSGAGDIPRIYLIRPIGGFKSEGVLGFAFRIPNGSGIFETAAMSASNPKSVAAVTLFDAANNQVKLTIGFGQGGAIRIWRGKLVWDSTNSTWWNNANVITTLAAGSYKEDVWQFCELKFKIDSTTGYLQLRINTDLILDLVDTNTNGTDAAPLTSSIDSYTFGIGTGSWEVAYAEWDDFYFNDLLGTVNNDYLGNVRVKTQFTIANGSHLDFAIGGTAPAATNYQSVQNTAEDDTRYVHATAVGNYDLYQMDPNLNSPLVHVVQARIVVKQDDSTQRTISAKMLLSGITYDCPEDAYTDQSYSHAMVRWELNPNTGVSFTGTEVNGIEIGPYFKA